MPLIRIAWFPRSDAKKAEFAQGLTRLCKDLLDSSPEDVEILFTDVEPGNWFAGGTSYATPVDG